MKFYILTKGTAKCEKSDKFRNVLHRYIKCYDVSYSNVSNICEKTYEFAKGNLYNISFKDYQNFEKKISKIRDMNDRECNGGSRNFRTGGVVPAR